MNRHFALGVIAGFALTACVSFRYKYYGTDLPSYDGTLLGRFPSEDESFKKCEPDERDKGKCTVMFTPEFEALRTDYVDCKARLIECERRCQ